MPKHKCKWEWLGETSQSSYEWCEECGSIKKTDLEGEDGTKIFRPKSFKEAK